MEPNTHTALFTTVSAVVGGVSKAMAAKVLLIAVTLPGLATVVLDACSYRINQFFNQSNKKGDE